MKRGKTHKNKVGHGEQSGEEASLHRHADDLEYDCLSTGAHVSGPVKRDAQNTGDGQVRYRGLLGSAVVHIIERQLTELNQSVIGMGILASWLNSRTSKKETDTLQRDGDVDKRIVNSGTRTQSRNQEIEGRLP